MSRPPHIRIGTGTLTLIQFCLVARMVCYSSLDDSIGWPFIALGREPHHADLMQRFGPEPLGPVPPEPMQAMAHRLNTREGRALYGLRKSTVEPVIGVIKW